MSIAAKHEADKGAEGKSVEKRKESRGHPRAAASDAASMAVAGRVLTAK